MQTLHRYLTAIILVISFLLPFSARGGEPRYEISSTGITTDSEILCALKDSYGFLWIGTADGLRCLDGNGKPVYPNRSGALQPISGLSVNAIHQVNDDIWLSTGNGLHVFERKDNDVKRFLAKTRYGVPVSAQVEKLLTVGKDRIWIATSGQGFFIYDISKATLTQNSRHGSFYTDLTTGSDGHVYLAEINGYIHKFRPDGTFVGQTRLPDHISDKSRNVMAACSKDIWIASGAKLYRMETGTNAISRLDIGDDIGTVASIINTTEDILIIGTSNGTWQYNTKNHALSKINPSDYRHDPNYDPKVTAITEDNDGDILIVHPEGAIDYIRRQEETLGFIDIPNVNPGSRRNTIKAIVTSDGSTGIWIGADSGLFLFDLNTQTLSRALLPTGTSTGITAILPDKGLLWIGTRDNGLIIYDPASGKSERHVYDEAVPYTIPSNTINAIYKTKSGVIHILTNSGLCRFDPSARNFPPMTDFGQQAKGTAMQEDREGGAWIATSNSGLYHRSPDGSRFDRIYEGEITKTTVTMLHLDKNGRLWAATQNDGIYSYDHATKDWIHADIPAINGMTPTFLADDEAGNLWVGSDGILVRIDKAGQGSLFSLSRETSSIPSGGAVCRTSDGKFAIGCDDGVVVFNPDTMKSYEDRIKVYPSTLSFPAAEGNPEEQKRLGLDRLLYTADTIEIPYSWNTFSISLAAARPLNVPDVAFDYMLEGVDKTWNQATSLSEITYSNVPAGSHRFFLRANGVKDAPVYELAIIVGQPWYQTGWAIAGYVLLFILLCIAIFLLVKNFMKSKLQKRMHELNIQKEREVFEAKTRYFVDLVHEIRTPLMLISLPLERLSERFHNDESASKDTEAAKHVGSMQQNLDYLLGITNQLLDFRKAESDSEIRLNRTRCNVNHMLTSIVGRFERPLETSGKSISLQMPNYDITAVIDREKTERLLMNLIGNAMKYASSLISVNLGVTDEDSIQISVSDDGPGIPDTERERIFETYYQIGNDNLAASLGTGLGLAYAKLIATAHKGTIAVYDSEWGGAKFTISIPKGAEEDAAAPESISTVDTPLNEEETSQRKDTTILLVEDNPELRAMLYDGLGRSFKVITAEDGINALELLEDNQIDIVVSDVMMPRMDGVELCRHCKEDMKYSHLPFILLTAKTGDEAREEGLKSGADAYLEKPFPMKQLSLVITNLLKTRLKFYEYMRATVGNQAAPRNPEEPGLNRVDSEFLQRLNTTIDSSLDDEDFSIDSLAEKLNLSRSSFYRKITGVTGMTPSDYLKNFRLNRAALLLKEGCRITEVAERTGFTSASYFAKCFRDKFGMLPSEYK